MKITVRESVPTLQLEDRINYVIQISGTVLDLGDIQLDHGSLLGRQDDDHPQYARHSLAATASDFLVGAQVDTTWQWIRKTRVETKTILDLQGTNTGDQNLSGYAPLASPNFTGLITNGTVWDDGIGLASTQGSRINLGQDSDTDGNPPLWVQKKFSKPTGTLVHYAGAGLFETWKQAGSTFSCVTTLTAVMHQEEGAGGGDAVAMHSRVIKSGGANAYASWIYAIRMPGDTTCFLHGLEIDLIPSGYNDTVLRNNINTPPSDSGIWINTSGLYPALAAIVIGGSDANATFWSSILIQNGGVNAGGICINMTEAVPGTGIKLGTCTVAGIDMGNNGIINTSFVAGLSSTGLLTLYGDKETATANRVEISDTGNLRIISGKLSVGTTSVAAKVVIKGAGVTSATYGLSVSDSGAADTFWVRDDGCVWIKDNCSALSYTDRTPFYKGDALAEIRAIKSRGDKINHKTLPKFVSAPNGERNLGNMVSLLTVAVQQLDAKITTLEKERKYDD
jgi:hypothetical protein